MCGVSIKKWDISHHYPTSNPKESGRHGGCPPETLKRHEGTSPSLINVLFYKATHHAQFPRDKGVQ